MRVFQASSDSAHKIVRSTGIGQKIGQLQDHGIVLPSDRKIIVSKDQGIVLSSAAEGGSETAEPGSGVEWVLGTDPGHSGALAAINVRTSRLDVSDMPVRTFGKTGNRKEVEGPLVVEWMKKHPALAFIQRRKYFRQLVKMRQLAPLAMNFVG